MREEAENRGNGGSEEWRSIGGGLVQPRHPPPKVEFKKVYEEIPRRKGYFRGQLVGIVLKV